MKTLYFQKHSPEKNLYYCSINGKCFEHDESGTYVLASEANEQDDWNVKKRKELELEQIKANERIKELENQLSPLSSATPSYVAGLNERIKVLEDAMKDIARQNLESEIHEDYREDADYRGAYDCIIRVARAAIKVK